MMRTRTVVRNLLGLDERIAKPDWFAPGLLVLSGLVGVLSLILLTPIGHSLERRWELFTLFALCSLAGLLVARRELRR